MAATQLTRTIGSAGAHKKGTFSAWIKKTKPTGEQFLYYSLENGNNNFRIRFDPETLGVQSLQGGSTNMHLNTNRVFRDPNAWYHIVVALDSSQNTSSDRCKIYVNGVQETSFSTSTYPSQDANVSINESGTVYIGGQNGSNYFNGIMSHVHWVDGTAYTPSTFGETDATTGEWKIKVDPGLSQANYGTNGFFILKDGNSVTDQSGNSNNLTVSGTLTNTEDCPSNVFATLNPLVTSSYSSLTLGNNTVKGNTAANDGETYSTLGTGNTGKWYWEIKATGLNGSGNPKLGFVQTNSDNIFRLQNGGSGYGGGSNSDSIMIRPDGKVIDDGSTSGVLYGTFSAGDILSFALDSDNGAFYYAINGTWQNSGDPTSGASKTGAVKTWTATSNKASHGQHVCIGTYDTATQADCNFGNGYFGTTAISSEGTNASGIGKFEYDVPTGYTALSTKGLNE